MATASPTPSQRIAGVACLAAGVLGAASGIWLAVVDATVPDTRYSYPLAAGAFIAIQIWFVIQHLGLFAGQWALRSTGVAGGGRAVTWGHLVALAGMALLTVTELLAVGVAEQARGTGLALTLDTLYGVSSTAIGVGMVIVGVGVRRARVWTGWQGWTPLAIGIWVFVPMMPALAAGHVPARLSITAWMLLYAALGWALITSHGTTGRELDAKRAATRATAVA